MTSRTNIVDTKNINVKIINIYRIIENELENWREVFIILNRF